MDISTKSDKDELVLLAKLAEQSERYDEMAAIMKKVVTITGDLSSEERNLLSVAFKNVVGSRRSAWRIFCNIEHRPQSSVGPRSALIMNLYKQQVIKELNDTCTNVLEILDKYLVPESRKKTEGGSECLVFYLKMVGDYYRYLAEASTDEGRKAVTDASLQHYKEASTVAEEKMPPTHPIRLGLALNFSVFHYEIMNSNEEACNLAQTAFDAAITELDSLSEDSYKDSTLIMQLLRDNLTLWTTEAQDDNNGEIGDAKE